MPNRYYPLLEDQVYHVYNRGFRREPIVLSDHDRNRFVESLESACHSKPIDILAYCLMPNHFHLLVRPLSGLDFSLWIRDLCNSYAKYYNCIHKRQGPVFEGRFKAKWVSNELYLLQVIKYILRNPVTAHLVNSMDEYPWSSWNAYKNYLTDSSWITPEPILDLFGETRKYQVRSLTDFIGCGDFSPTEYALYEDHFIDTNE